MRTLPRIQSAFILLKRVGFAVLLLVTISLARAQGPDTLWMRLHCPDSTFLNYVYEMDVIENDEMLVFGAYLSSIDEVRSFYMSGFDSDGNFLFRSSFGRSMLSGDFCKVSEGLYGVAGSDWDENGINWYAALIGADGTVHWERTVVMPDDQVLPQICGTGDGGMLVVSQDEGPVYGYSIGIVKFNVLGDTVFTRRIVYDEPLGIRDVAMTNDGGFAVLRSSGHLLKLDSSGDLEFERRYQYGVSTDLNFVAVLPGGDLVMTGGVRVAGGDPIEPLFVRVNHDGDVLWSHIEDWPDGTPGYSGGDVKETPEGGFVIASAIEDTWFLIRYDRFNNEQWRQSYNYDNPSRGNPTTLSIRSNNGLAVAGDAPCPGNPSLDAISLFATEIDPYILDAPVIAVRHPESFEIGLSPNPFNSTLSISLNIPLHQEVSLTLYDLLGREVDVIHHGRLSANTISYTAPPELSSGIYFLRAATTAQSQIQKVVLLK